MGDANEEILDLLELLDIHLAGLRSIFEAIGESISFKME
jgi:hypothetical protein